VRLVFVHARAQLRELWRYPAFAVPTLVLPALFFLIFVVPRVEPARANAFMAFYAAFGVLGIAFFQFGVGIANERVSQWELFLRVLPVSAAARFAARILAALAFASAATTLVLAVALFTTPAALSTSRWAALVAVLALGAVPCALLGIAIGYWAPPRAALPLANLLYLLLAYAGGLWTGFAALPGAVEDVSPFLPTRQWAEALEAAVDGGGRPAGAAVAWLVYTLAFGALALLGYRRDEGERFA
jgi:ABC-2 type transport system permease protein